MTAQSPAVEKGKQRQHSLANDHEAHKPGQRSTVTSSEHSGKTTEMPLPAGENSKKTRAETNAGNGKPKGGFFSWLRLKSPRAAPETAVSNVLHAFRDDDRKAAKDCPRKEAEKNTAKA